MKAFVSVCEEKSIARAAEREHTVASAVSKRISEMESILGTPLLYRHRNGVSPTPAGESLLRHARHILHEMEVMAAELSEHTDGARGHVRIYANRSAIIQFLPEDLAAFSSEFPQVRLDLEEHMSEAVVEAVEHGVADVGVCNASTPAHGLQTFHYRDDRLVVVVPASHPLAGRPSLAFHETLDFDQVGLLSGDSFQQLLLASSKQAGKLLRFRVHVASFDAVCRMVQAGMGLGVIPASAVPFYQGGTGVVAIALDDVWAKRELKIVCRDYQTLPVTSRRFVDHLRSSDQ
ncbi:MAG: LysR family transcriptional regulator [Janthinobacterium lividum]